MVNAHMTGTTVSHLLDPAYQRLREGLPLKIVRSRVPVLPLWTKWTDIARAVMYQAVADHLVLALEPFAAFGAGAARNRTIVWATLAVDIFV